LADLFKGIETFRVLENAIIFRHILGLLLIAAFHEPADWSWLLAHELRAGALVRVHTFKARSSEMMPFLSDVFHWRLILSVVHTDMAHI